MRVDSFLAQFFDRRFTLLQIARSDEHGDVFFPS